MTGGLSLAELIQLLGAQGGGDLGAANISSLVAPIGAGGIQGQNFGQVYTAGNTAGFGAGQGGTSAGTIAGQTSGNAVDPTAMLLKLLNVGQKVAGLASPTQGAGDLGTQADLSGLTTEQQQAFQQQRTGERQDFTSSLPTGFLQQAVAAGATPADFQALGLSGPEIEKAFATRPGAAPGASITSGTVSDLSGTNVGGEIQGGLGGSNTFGQVAGGLGAGAGLFGLIQALRSGNTAGFGPGVGQTLQGLVQLLRNSPDLLNSLPEGIRGLFGAPPSSTVGSGIGGVGSALSLIGGLTGSKGLGELGADIGGLGSLATTVGPMVSALASGDTAAFEAATAALSAAAPAAVVAAAIQMAVTLASDISAGASPLQTTFDTLASPDVIASAIARNVVDPAFLPSAAWRSFPERVTETAGLEEQGLRALMQGLPEVQSQAELGSLVNAFKGLIGVEVGGYGQGSGPYDIPALPEVGPRTHGVNTTPTNFAAITPGINQEIQVLLPRLPATGQPFDLMRDLYQFLPRREFAPMQYLRYGFGGENDQIFNSAYGDAGYNYAASGYPDPGQFIGQVSPFWQQAGLPLLPQRYAGPQTSGGPRLAVPEGLSTFNRASVPGTPEYALATGDMTGLPDWQAAQIASQLNANNLGVAP